MMINSDTRRDACVRSSRRVTWAAGRFIWRAITAMSLTDPPTRERFSATRDTGFAGSRGNCYTISSVTELPGLRSEEHTSELQSQSNLVCRLLLEKKKKQELTMCTSQ